MQFTPSWIVSVHCTALVIPTGALKNAGRSTWKWAARSRKSICSFCCSFFFFVVVVVVVGCWLLVACCLLFVFCRLFLFLKKEGKHFERGDVDLMSI